MATFQAEIGRKRMRKREIKITVTFRSYPTYDRKFQKKNSKKIQKIKKCHYDDISSENKTEKFKKDRK